jgi:hypothetical protein
MLASMASAGAEPVLELAVQALRLRAAPLTLALQVVAAEALEMTAWPTTGPRYHGRSTSSRDLGPKN